MHQLIDDWNKAHKPYFVEFCVFPCLKSGESLEEWTMSIYNLDTDTLIYRSRGNSFIRLYNKLEHEWDKIKGDSE